MNVAPAHPPQIPFHFFPKSSSPPSLIPPVVVKKRVVPVPPQAPRATPRPLDNIHERKPSQASSVLPITDESIPRECHIDEDAVLDDTFLSSEKVVLGIMKSYVQCKS